MDSNSIPERLKACHQLVLPAQHGAYSAGGHKHEVTYRHTREKQKGPCSLLARHRAALFEVSHHVPSAERFQIRSHTLMPVCSGATFFELGARINTYNQVHSQHRMNGNNGNIHIHVNVDHVHTHVSFILKRTGGTVRRVHPEGATCRRWRCWQCCRCRTPGG